MKFDVNALVWAKLKFYPYWPARVVNPPAGLKASAKRKHICVFFFGTENYAWVLETHVRSFQENDIKKYHGKRPSFKRALQEILRAFEEEIQMVKKYPVLKDICIILKRVDEDVEFRKYFPDSLKSSTSTNQLESCETTLASERKFYDDLKAEVSNLKQKLEQSLTENEKNNLKGLRGLLNLGNTCFVNCIVQVLVHTPSLCDYFLSHKHICHLQEIREKCIACEMFNVFQEFHTGQTEPHILSKLLYLIWIYADALIGFDQQDAHEFLLELLNGLHDHCQNKETDQKLDHTVNPCNCIIHQIFSGFYHSYVFCSECKYESTSIDLFWDISLNMGETGRKKDGIDPNPESLEDCLRRHTRRENLQDIKCSNCQANDSTMKHLTFKELPVVACFHFKRLAAPINDYPRRKVDNKNTTHVMFPEFLDMSPFLSTTCGKGNNLPNGDHSRDLHSSKNIFSLFAVVSHRGDQAGGHYISYIRQHSDRWYLCNDDTVMKSSLDHVLQSEGYLLFYHQDLESSTRMGIL